MAPAGVPVRGATAGGEEVRLGRPQVSFAKRQREQAKRERQQLKAERRAQRKTDGPGEEGESGPPIATPEEVESLMDIDNSSIPKP